MRVSAISLSGIHLNSIEHYRDDLRSLLKSSNADLAVLPAYSSLLLGLALGEIKAAATFRATIQNHLSNNGTWNNTFLELHSTLARELTIHLAVGTIIENDSGYFYHTACCFDPAGEICCIQRQTHLTRNEREIGFSRGEELNLFKIGNLKGGLIVGNDARHPEIGRIFGLSGADIILHCGALESEANCWVQAAGMWAQVQQNQFWAVEAQLSGRIATSSFSASSAVLGPCEITPGQSGYLSRGYPETDIVTAELVEEARLKLIENYPLLKLLNPAAYAELIYE